MRPTSLLKTLLPRLHIHTIIPYISARYKPYGGWPTGTIDDYYTEISYGNLTLSGQTLGWYLAANTRAYYGNGQKGGGTYPQNTARLVEEAVDAAETAGCDFSQYDNDGDGEAESIIIVHVGEGAETSLDANDIQSHVSKISSMGGTARTYDGVVIDRYACCPELQASSPAAHINIGVYCHEHGHVLGLPDLYDVSRRCTSITSWGIGAWGLMSFGGWGGDVVTPSSPSHMCSWSKIQMGWLTPIAISGWSQMASLSGVEQSPQALKIGMNTRETEYFLVEYRDSSLGFDRSLVKRGLLIYHIDNDAWSENDCENGGTCTSGGFNYMVALEQPDSSYDLDCGTSGNYTDLETVAHAGPNPFKDRVTIRFSVGIAGPVSLSIYDVGGRLVKSLARSDYSAGTHSVTWDGTDHAGNDVGAGVYFYRFSSEQRARTGKLSLLR